VAVAAERQAAARLAAEEAARAKAVAAQPGAVALRAARRSARRAIRPAPARCLLLRSPVRSHRRRPRLQHAAQPAVPKSEASSKPQVSTRFLI
jgi:hypothetical protein